MTREELLAACRAAAREAATFIEQQSRRLRELDWQPKARVDFVSMVDTGAEERIRAMLLRCFPDARIIGEELSPDETRMDGLVFAVDPLDGTTNFLHGYPQYAVSIAAMMDGTLEACVVHDVPRAVQYTASRGDGAYREAERITVSRIENPGRALIGTGFPFRDPQQLEPYMGGFQRVAREAAGIRRAGAAALDLVDVACGRFDAFWELSLSSWDVAAGILLVREAGGVVTDINGVEKTVSHGSVVAGNPVMHNWLLKALSP
ncbi:MAG TPA: inositol monophosphatase family protein [Gemmatimonadaceae bacterium]|nr:inositol monophosphatase family protein [Gemmatimonadaceae bacterium]